MTHHKTWIRLLALGALAVSLAVSCGPAGATGSGGLLEAKAKRSLAVEWIEAYLAKK